MSSPIKISHRNGNTLFYFEQLSSNSLLDSFSCDADIEHNKGVLTFYEKNGFISNEELNNKNRKTISMRKDIYVWIQTVIAFFNKNVLPQKPSYQKFVHIPQVRVRWFVVKIVDAEWQALESSGAV